MRNTLHFLARGAFRDAIVQNSVELGGEITLNQVDHAHMPECTELLPHDWLIGSAFVKCRDVMLLTCTS